MPARRSYAEIGDACATAHGVELIGAFWTYPILRELMLAPKRFNELLRSLPGVTPAVLTSRIRELEGNGLLVRTMLPPPADVTVYQLTDWARRLTPILDELGRWAHDSPIRAVDGSLTPDGAAQALRTMAPQVPVDPPVALTLRLHDGRLDAEAAPQDGYDYRIDWDTAGFRIERGMHPQTQTVVAADSTAWTAMVLGGGPPADLTVTGERGDLDRLLALFVDAVAARRS